jgi:predicted GTPase
MIRGKRVLVIEDGPTLTHGEMPFGAGIVAAETFKAAEIVDPRPFAQGSLKETYTVYPHIGNVIPAMGYTPDQISDLEETIDKTDCDLVVFATPIHLPLVLNIQLRSLSQQISDQVPEINRCQVSEQRRGNTEER